MTQPLSFHRLYKYQLDKPASALTAVVGFDVRIPLYPGSAESWVELTTEGVIRIRHGYSWDGASGPAIDTPDFMLGSLVHDALYQMIHEGILPRSARKAADQTLRDLCKAEGMSAFRRWYVYIAVRAFGWLHV